MVIAVPSVLVAVDAAESDTHVMEVAIKLAEREDGSLVVLHAMPPDVYGSRQLSIGRSTDLQRDGFTYTITQAEADARTIAREAARKAVGNRDVRYIAVGKVGPLVPTVVATATEYSCATIVIPQEKSWWKRLFGLGHRRLANRFDGTLVQVPHPGPPAFDPDRTPHRPVRARQRD